MNIQNEDYAFGLITKVLNVSKTDIKDIKTLKKGMTNRSFMFTCNDVRYIMRVPGEGTDKLINRVNESMVYNVIKDKDICDDIVYIDPQNGCKITKYIENTRCCDPYDELDLVKCMNYLKRFHNLKLKVNHEFDLYDRIEYYEALWEGKGSIYDDYKTTKENVYKLKSFIDSLNVEKCLTHVDAVPDNFLFTNNGEERIYLIDWEYASMQDPHLDIAMFCVYAMYDRKSVDKLIDIYFEGKCDKTTRLKIYCYIALSGLVWSNWCEYKRQLGVEFGEYSTYQYNFAREYYEIVVEMLQEEEKCLEE